MKLSIIVSVYNVEKYLDEALNSLYVQKTDDVEFLVVNDSSPDNSRTIIEKYVSMDPRFKLIDKENGGLSDVRNYGIRIAEAEYVAFLDGDDILDKNCLEDVLKRLDEDPDLIVYDSLYFWDESDETKSVKGINELSDDYLKSLLLSSPTVNNKVFRKSIIEKYPFPLRLYYEDLATTPRLASEVKKMIYIPKNYNIYRQRSGSIIYTYSEKCKDIFTALKMVMDYYNENSLLDKYTEEIEYLVIEHLLLYGNRRFFYFDKPNEMYKMSKDFYKKYFDNPFKNKYYKKMSLNDRIFIRLSYNLQNSLIKAMIGLKGLIKR